MRIPSRTWNLLVFSIGKIYNIRMFLLYLHNRPLGITTSASNSMGTRSAPAALVIAAGGATDDTDPWAHVPSCGSNIMAVALVWSRRANQDRTEHKLELLYIIGTKYIWCIYIERCIVIWWSVGKLGITVKKRGGKETFKILTRNYFTCNWKFKTLSMNF